MFYNASLITNFDKDKGVEYQNLGIFNSNLDDFARQNAMSKADEKAHEILKDYFAKQGKKISFVDRDVIDEQGNTIIFTDCELINKDNEEDYISDWDDLMISKTEERKNCNGYDKYYHIKNGNNDIKSLGKFNNNTDVVIALQIRIFKHNC